MAVPDAADRDRCSAIRCSASRRGDRGADLLRPSIVLLTAGIVAAGLGIVLYNAGLSALAVGLLVLSLARPAPAPE